MSIHRHAHQRIAHSSRLRTLAALLVVLVLLPALIYSTVLLSTLSTQERLITDIYRQQLDVVLFSINQYAWDLANSWFGDIRRTLDEKEVPSTRQFAGLISSSQSIRTLFATDTAATEISLLAPEVPSSPPTDLVLKTVSQQDSAIRRLLYRLRAGYQTVEPFQLTANPSTIVLVSPWTVRGGPPRLLGIVIDVDSFVNFVLAPKLSETGGGEFLLAVTQGREKRLVYATAETDPTDLEQSRRLWILPDYSLWVRLRSGTIEDLASARSKETLVLAVSLDLLLLVGVVFVFRLTRREIELAQLKSNFISSVSHELRTPLSLIRMSAESLLLGRVSTPERATEHHQIIVRETDRLTRLVNNVLLFSRLEAGKEKLVLSEADLNEVVRTALDDFGPEFARRGFVVETHLAEHPPQTRLNAEAVTEALLNLLDNAMKFSDQQTTLRVVTGTHAHGVYVEVKDFGIGISPEFHTKIFERFYRVSSSAQNQKRGSGLGLTLVKQIMDVHGGSVTVQSEPGKGSTFRLTFPALITAPTNS